MEYTLINEPTFYNLTQKNHFFSYFNTNVPEIWSLSQYLQFLREYHLYKLNEYEILHHPLDVLEIPNLQLQEIMDITSDYEKTLWCWCQRLKQAIESNSKNFTLDTNPDSSLSYNSNSVYFTFLLQTIGLLQQQKLKRYQLLLSY